MTLPTRDGIAAILDPVIAVGYPKNSVDVSLTLADAILARLRPGWERMEQELTTLEAVLSPDTYDADAQVEKIAALGKLADAILAERDALRADLRAVAEALTTIREIIEHVDGRAMAADGPVSPTREEMSDEEFRRIYRLLVKTLDRPGVQAGLK